MSGKKAGSKKLAIVAVESSLVGRTVVPRYGRTEDPHGACAHLWPFATKQGTTVDYVEDTAEIVAVFVGDLNDGGSIKFLIAGTTTGQLHQVYASNFKLAL